MFNRNRERNRQLQIGEVSNGGSADSVLSNLFQKILHKCEINPQFFNHLLEQFVLDPRNAIPRNIKEQSSARGNLRKELMKAVMSWKVFCKGLRFINVRQFRITIELQHANHKITSHSHTVALEDIEESEFNPFKDNEVTPINSRMKK